MECKDKMIEKISKLLNLANDPSASVGEIENAMKMANKLMLKHDIDSENIELGFDSISEQEFTVEMERTFSSTWKWDLIDCIANNNMCYVYAYSHGYFTKKDTYRRTHNRIVLVGNKSKRKIVMNMYNLCVERLPNLCSERFEQRKQELISKYLHSTGLDIDVLLKLLKNEKVLPSKRKFYNSYLLGFRRGLESKFKQNIMELDMDEKSKYGLIVVKNDDLIKEYMKDDKIKTSKRTIGSLDAKAIQMGREDAEHVENINQLNA